MLSVDDFHESYIFNDWSIQYVPLRINFKHVSNAATQIIAKKQETQGHKWYMSSQKKYIRKNVYYIFCW